MKIIYSPVHKKHNPSFEVYDGEKSAYPEVPDRIETILAALKKEKLGTVLSPQSFSLDHIEKIHHRNYITFLQKKSASLNSNANFFASYFIMDTYAPLTNGTFLAAKKAVDTALTAAELVKNGERLVYALSRPPGHHAGYVNMGGYCYFNNAAIAAEYLSQFGKVALLDIDYHHGNGTQQAFYQRDDILYVSLHVDPNKKYPYISGFASEDGIGKGKGYNKNYPLPLKTTEKVYAETLTKALVDIHTFHPVFFIISAGFDTYVNDPIGSFQLSIPFYQTIGKLLAGLQLPTLVIQEGGYCVADLGSMAVQLIKGLQSPEVS